MSTTPGMDTATILSATADVPTLISVIVVASVPGYLDEPLAGLARAGLIALADIDTWGQRRVAPTLDGRTRYVELSAKRCAPIDPPTGRIPPRGPVGSGGLDRPPPDDQPADRWSVEAGGMAS